MNTKICISVLSAAITLPLLPVSLAVAADSDTEESSEAVTLQEVVVTAEKRVERLQDIPMSVSALSGQYLQETGAESFQDYLTSVPGVSFFQNGGQTNAIFIRGVSSGVDITSSSTTGVYIDESPVTQSIGATVDLNPFDLERVEVLRGPQGTLYGAASMGGTIRLIMNKPQFDAFSVTAEAKVSDTEHGGSNYEVDSAVNLPVTDQFALRLVGGYRDLSGYIDNLNPNINDANYDRESTFRGMARWKPADTTDILLTMSYQNEYYGAHPQSYVGSPYGPYQAGFGYPETGTQPFKLIGLTINQDFGFATLTSATNYFRKDSLAVRDFTPYAPLLGITLEPGQGLGADLYYHSGVFTQEMRLASKDTGSLHWLIGGFYSGGKGPDLDAVGVSNAPALAGVNIWSASIPTRQHQTAAFGEIGYHITSQLDLTAGLRTSYYTSHGFDDETGLFNGPVPTAAENSARDHFLDQRYTASYKLNEAALVYAQAASGSRPGVDSGASGLTSACVDELHSDGINPIPSQTNPDTLWTYEIGSKNTLAGGRATADLAAYYTRWKDVQSELTLNCGVEFAANTGAAVIKGIEFEGNLQALQGLTLGLSLAYTHTEVTQGVPDEGALEGESLPLVPKFNGNVNARYEFPLPSGSKGFVRGDVTYVSSEFADFEARPTGYPISAYTLANGRLGWRKGQYEVALYGTNLMDRRIVTYIGPSLAGPLEDTILRPRTLGLDLKMSF
jgi:iron complex outermembrane recepter protein